jgi:hypothetical protein
MQSVEVQATFRRKMTTALCFFLAWNVHPFSSWNMRDFARYCFTKCPNLVTASGSFTLIGEPQACS